MTMTNLGGAVDGKLQALMTAAEEGRPVPRIRLLAGTWLIQGQPVSTATFLAITGNDFAEQLKESKEWRRVKGNQAAADSLVQERVGPVMAAFGGATEADGMALSLRDAVLIGGATLKVPAIRVPLLSIQAWWNTTMEVEQARTYSTGIGVGFSF